MGIMVAFDAFEETKSKFDEIVARYSNFVNEQTTLLNTAVNAAMNGATSALTTATTTTTSIDTTGTTAAVGGVKSSSLSPVAEAASNTKQAAADVAAVLDAVPSSAGLVKNVPPVGILRAQQYESIASNMHMFNSSDARKCSISFDRDLSRDNSQNQTTAFDEEAINILNIFVRNNENKPDDESLVRIFLFFILHL